MNADGNATDTAGMAYLACRAADNSTAGGTVFAFAVIVRGPPFGGSRPATVEVTYRVHGIEQTRQVHVPIRADSTGTVPLDSVGIDGLAGDTQVCCRLVDVPGDYQVDPKRNTRCEPAKHLRPSAH